MRISSLLLLVLVSCTDARIAQFTSLGSSGHIICYSGGKVIVDAISTGKIATEEGSDGWYFKDSKNGKLVRAGGDCVIEN